MGDASNARRVLLLITDLEIGGTPTVVRELATRLNADPRFEIEVACLSKWGPVADQLREAKVHVTALNARGLLEAPRTVALLVRLIRDRRYGTVFSFLVHANTVAAASSLFCRDVRYLQSIQTTQKNPAWHWRVQSIVHHAAEKVIVPSKSVAEVAGKWSQIPPEKIQVIPNAVELAEFSGIRSPEINSGQPVSIGFIGRLDPVKRIGDLLHAVQQLRGQVHLHVFGAGPALAEIQSTIAQLQIGDQITMHGAVSRPQEALAKISVLVLPSEAEGFGLVLIEAMASGIPVVATDVAGIRDVVQDAKTGILVPVGSPERLADGIRRVIVDAEVRRALIGRAKEYVGRKFSWGIVLDEYKKLLVGEENAHSAPRRG